MRTTYTCPHTTVAIATLDPYPRALYTSCTFCVHASCQLLANTIDQPLAYSRERFHELVTRPSHHKRSFRLLHENALRPTDPLHPFTVVLAIRPFIRAAVAGLKPLALTPALVSVSSFCLVVATNVRRGLSAEAMRLSLAIFDVSFAAACTFALNVCLRHSIVA
jgi:hypothetical protein